LFGVPLPCGLRPLACCLRPCAPCACALCSLVPVPVPGTGAGQLGRGKAGAWAIPRGRQKKKSRGPPWWVGGSEYEKGPGSDLFFRYFFIVFLNSPHRETPKNVINKNSRKSRFWISGRIFCKNFSTRFFL
jgi:hypothetical protein